MIQTAFNQLFKIGLGHAMEGLDGRSILKKEIRGREESIEGNWKREADKGRKG